MAATQDMSREAWLELRREGIGASEAAAVLGQNPYQTPYELYRLKVGLDIEADLSDNEKVQWGIRLENLIAEQWSEVTGHRVERVNSILRSSEHPFMLCNLDRRVVGLSAVLEVKTTGQWAVLAAG